MSEPRREHEPEGRSLVPFAIYENRAAQCSCGVLERGHAHATPGQVRDRARRGDPLAAVDFGCHDVLGRWSLECPVDVQRRLERPI